MNILIVKEHLPQLLILAAMSTEVAYDLAFFWRHRRDMVNDQERNDQRNDREQDDGAPLEWTHELHSFLDYAWFTAYTSITLFWCKTTLLNGAVCAHQAWKTKCMTRKNTNKYAPTMPNRFQLCFDFGHQSQVATHPSSPLGTITRYCNHFGQSLKGVITSQF